MLRARNMDCRDDGAHTLVRLAKVLAVLASFDCAAAAVVPTFVDRPSCFQREFPSRDSFRRAGGRRLQAADGKPARSRYDFEEGGFRFAYEVSAESDVGQLVNADHDAGVAAIACDAQSMWVKWGVSGRQLAVGDVVSGGAEWGCEDGGFVREVTSVQAGSRSLVSAVETRPTSTLGVFRDLFVDLTWSRVARPPQHRRVQGDWDNVDGSGNESAQAEEDELFRIVDEDGFDDLADDDAPWMDTDFGLQPMAFNLNESSGEANDTEIDIGGLRCSNCWARLEPSASLRIETTGIVPSLVSFRLDLDFEIELQIEQAPTMSQLIELWIPILTFGGLNLVNTMAHALGMPIFHALNEAYLGLSIQPYTSLHLLLASIEDIVMDGTAYANVSGTSDSTFIEVRWDRASGFNVNASADLERSFHYSGTELGARVTTGLRPCVGVRVMLTNPVQYLTQVEACPELTMFFDNTGNLTDFLSPIDFAGTAAEADAELCIEFLSLDTDINLDFLNRDEPYARACFLGRCIESAKDRVFGASSANGACNCTSRCGVLGSCDVDIACDESGSLPCSSTRVHWWDGPQCMPVVRGHLSQADVTFHAFERDPVGDEAYGEALSFIPLERCPGLVAGRGLECLLELELAPSGKDARLAVALSVRDLPAPPLVRRVQDRAMDSQCQGTRWGVQFGASGRFSGLRLPVYFRLGGLRSGRMIVDPVESPSVRPVTLHTGCDVDPDLVTHTAATTLSPLVIQAQARAWAAVDFMNASMPGLNIIDTSFARPSVRGCVSAAALCYVALLTAGPVS